ncbi:glycosyltransferase [uncultured Microbacterium sp.]|uniref:glycosyltransferase n=1 Tax=uncultured Microbacterium sp. TaxID=191216 RepID=UPI0025FA0022|nr:glycosyltransferase [uncultured Microbacterium sp.]
MSSARPDTDLVFVVGAPDDPATRTAAIWADALAASGIATDTVTLRTLPGRGGARVAALAARLDALAPRAVVGAGTAAALAALAARELTTRPPAIVASEHLSVAARRRSRVPAVRIGALQARRRYRSADVVIASSHALAAEVNAGCGVPASRSLVVPPPVPGVVTTGGAREPRVPGTGGGVTVVVAGDPLAADDPLRVVAAAGELDRRGIAVELVVRPGGALSEAVRRAAVSRGLTVRADDGSWGPSAVVVLGAATAGFGVELVRAAARGVPAVAVSTALGVADAIVPGVTGELAVAGDAVAVADAIVAASRLEVAGVDDWLARFAPASSARLLLRAVDLAVAHADAGRAVPA